MKANKRKVFLSFVLGFGVCLIFLIPKVTNAFSLPSEKIIQLINDERAQYNIEPLISDEQLIIAAENKLSDMIENDYFAHQNPDGKMPWDFMEDASYNYKYAGENLATDYESADEVVSAWLASPTHRQNILNEKFNDIGMAIKVHNGHSMIVQFFGSESYETKSKNVMLYEQETRDILITNSLSSQEPIPLEQETVISGNLIISDLSSAENQLPKAENEKVLGISHTTCSSFGQLLTALVICYLLILTQLIFCLFEKEYESQKIEDLS